MILLLPLAWGNPWVMFIVPVVFLALLFLVGGMCGLGFVTVFRIRREFKMRTIVLFAFAGIFAFYAWTMCFNSPLPLPEGATSVRIQRAMPLFTWEINDNLSFKLKEPEFRRWIESLVGRPWSEMIDGRTDAKIRQNFGFQRPLSAPEWMQSNATTIGYTITAHPKIYGTIWYDSEREIVHYHFDD